MDVIIWADGVMARLLTEAFAEKPSYKVVGTVTSRERLLQMVNSYKQIVIVCDISSNPSMLDSLEQDINQKKLKFLIIAKNVTEGFNALSKGAIEMTVAPTSTDKNSLPVKSFNSILHSKVSKIYREYGSEERGLKRVLTFNKNIHKVIGIGSSTGGTEVMLGILRELPADTPPVLIVQHMPAVFTRMYAKRLDTECKMSVWEAQDGDEVRPGLALVAPGEKQMRIEQRGGKYIVTCRKEGKFGGHQPSVDILFNSIAKEIGKNSIGVMLTGMGRDGADGMLNMRNQGGYTIGQDEKTSMVYGMPKAAFDIGAVEIQAPPSDMARLIMNRR